MNFDSEIIRIVVQSKIQRFEIKSTILGYGHKVGMQSSVYDPNQIVSDAFDMDNMIEGNENKILTSIERTKLEEIEEGAEVNVQSDMAQTDDTKDDFVKNKKGENIITTLYMYDEDEGEMIPILEENIDNMITIIYSVILDLYNYFDYYDEEKQDKITDNVISVEPYEWSSNECRKYIGQINSNDKVWYSPTEYSYDDFVNAEIRMTEVGNGYVDFKCKNTPTETIEVIIRRAS